MPGQPDPAAPGMPPSSPPPPSAPPPPPVPPQPTVPTPPAPEPAMPSTQAFTPTPTGFAAAPTSAPAPQAASVPPPPSSSHHIKRILIAVVLLILLGSAGYYVYALNFASSPQAPAAAPTVAPPSPTPTPDITTNWKEYINTKYGFTMKYPPEWVYALGKGGDSQIVFETNAQALEAATKSGAVIITITSETTTPLIKEDARNKIASTKTLQIGGYPGEQAVFQDAANPTGTTFIQSATAYNGKAYYFNLNEVALQTIYDHMLQSLAFNPPPANSGAQGAAAPLGAPSTATGAGVASPAAR